jgi:copper homeostasis protein
VEPGAGLKLGTDVGARMILEICVDSLDGVAAAVAGGADRIELCAALELGGLTPSAALLAQAVATGLPVHAMIRPRAGGFVVEPAELTLMLDDIRRAAALGAVGVVVGALLPDDRLDEAALARMREVAQDLVVVLHRAIDLTPDPIAATGWALALGYDKVLSSGGARTANGGAAVLRQMVSVAGNRLSVIAGSGIRPDNVGQLIAATGVREVHASASVPGPVPNARLLEYGFVSGPRCGTDLAAIQRLRAAAMKVWKP